MKIALGSDHAGYALKEVLVAYLKNKGYQVKDYGTNSLESVDYPDFAYKVATSVANGKEDFGIIICGTGIGISIAANKVEGIRAALVYDKLTARLAKEHNHANIIALGGRTTNSADAVEIVDAYLNAQIENRHQKRIDKITKIEKKEIEHES